MNYNITIMNQKEYTNLTRVMNQLLEEEYDRTIKSLSMLFAFSSIFDREDYSEEMFEEQDEALYNTASYFETMLRELHGGNPAIFKLLEMTEVFSAPVIALISEVFSIPDQIRRNQFKLDKSLNETNIDILSEYLHIFLQAMCAQSVLEEILSNVATYGIESYKIDLDSSSDLFEFLDDGDCSTDAHEILNYLKIRAEKYFVKENNSEIRALIRSILAVIKEEK